MVQNALNDLSKPHFYLFGARNATIYIYIYILVITETSLKAKEKGC